MGEGNHSRNRVDWSLLAKLNDLDAWLQGNGLTSEVSHSLIGKYVYLYYLRHRDILSDRKLAKWGLEQDAIFSRNASRDAFWSVVEKLDGWLNGSAFVLERSKHSGVTESQLRKVAGTFRGDDPRTGQLVLDFGIYEFLYPHSDHLGHLRAVPPRPKHAGDLHRQAEGCVLYAHSTSRLHA